MDKPLVSAIIPAYNAEKSIDRCINSLLKQSYENIEIIVVNDGSTDNTAVHLQAFDDPRLRVIEVPNGGVSKARNIGIRAAQGSYLQFLDADDYVTKDATFLLLNKALQNAADLVVADFYRVNKGRVSAKGDIATDEPLTRKDYALYMLERPADYYYGVLWNKLYRRSIIIENDLAMAEDVSFCEDFLFNLDYLRHCETIVALRVPIYYYFKTAGSLVAQNTSFLNLRNTKKSVFAHYKSFYQDLFAKEDFEEILPSIYRFLIESSHDEFALPLFSGHLGEERISIKDDFLNNNDLISNIYLLRKLFEALIEPLAINYDLSIDTAIILLAIGCGHHNRKELKELLMINPAKLETHLSVLLLKHLIDENLQLTDESFMKQTAVIFEHFQDQLFKDIDPDEKEQFLRLSKQISQNIASFLKA